MTQAVHATPFRDHDPVEHALAWHDGDARAAIRTLLEDCRHLRQQLALATAAMGHGYTRGWKPSEEREGLEAD